MFSHTICIYNVYNWRTVFKSTFRMCTQVYRMNTLGPLRCFACRVSPEQQSLHSNSPWLNGDAGCDGTRSQFTEETVGLYTIWRWSRLGSTSVLGRDGPKWMEWMDLRGKERKISLPPVFFLVAH